MSEKVRNIWNKIKKIPKQRLIRIGIISTLIIILIILITLANKSKKEIEQKEEQGKYEIAFENESYTCEEGKEIDVMLKPGKREFPNDIYVVSSDTSIATVDNNADLKCDNCKKVVVACKKSGEAKINAIYNNETITTTGIHVSENKKIVYFEYSSYTCRSGQSFETIVKVNERMSASEIKSITGGDGLEIDENVSSPATCSNCKKIKITCHGGSSNRIVAEMVNGMKGFATVNVEGDIYTGFMFLSTASSKKSLTDPRDGITPSSLVDLCKVNEVFWLKISKSACMNPKITCPKIVSWESEDSTIVEVSKETWDNDYVNGQVKGGFSAPGFNVRVTCHKPGMTKIYVTDENGLRGIYEIAVE